MTGSALPFVTAALPGTGGAAKVVPEDFVVEELPAYLPSGSGEHLFVLAEKRGLDTRELVRAVARALSVAERDVGYAGQKDRHAVTTQWLSLPGVAPARAAGLAGEGFRILEAALHGNKLRTGHLRGNRFRIRLRGVDAGGAARARAIAAALGHSGLANFYGPQRFGRGSDNAEVGRLLLRNDPDPRARRAARDHRQRRLLISAFQSACFNELLAVRLREGSWCTPLAGDVLEKATGGLFLCTDPATDAARVASFECSVTGPMPGAKMRPAPTGVPAELEARVLAGSGVTAEELARCRDAPGARRALRIPVQLEVQEEAELGSILLTFALPPGSYATELLREVQKPEPEPEPEPEEAPSEEG